MASKDWVSAEKQDKNSDQIDKLKNQENVPKLRFPGFNDEWVEKKLFEISDINDGTHKTPDYVNNGIPFFSVENITNSTPPKKISIEEHNKLIKRCHPKKGDILLTRIGTLAKSKIIDWDYEFSIYVSLALINSIKIYNFFLYQYLKTPSYQKDFFRRSLLLAVPQKINLKDLNETTIKYPSNEEQYIIGNFLLIVDKKIELMEKKYKQLDAYKKKLIKDVFNQNILFKEDNKWKTYKFKELGKIKSGIGFKKEYQGYTNFNYNFYKVSDMNLKGNEKYMNKSNNTINNEICKKLKTTIIDEPALIFAKVGEAIFLNRKRVVIKPFLIDNNMMAFIPNDKIDLNFLYYLSQTINFAKYAQTGALPSYNASDIYSIKCKIPNLNKQHEISVMFSLFDQKLNFINKKIEKTKEFKKYLLQQMFV